MVESEIVASHSLRLVVRNVHVPDVMVRPPFIDRQDVVFPTYENDPCNSHHWRFEYVWADVMPYIASQLDIPFNTEDFIVVPVSGGASRLRHVWHTDFKCVARPLDSGSAKVYTYRDCCQGGGLSAYHGVVRYPHESVLYTVDSPVKSTRKLLVNTDSMAIPLVPLLLPYYSEVLFLDFRRKITPADLQVIENFKFTDYLCLLIASSYKNGKHLRNLTVGERSTGVTSTSSKHPVKRKFVLDMLRRRRKLPRNNVYF